MFDDEAGAGAEVQGEEVQSLQELRTPAGVHPSIPDLSHLLPRTGQPREDSGSGEGELVR